ncbi:MAG: hypothetical protein KIT83_05115 [Bryobacterales bacterium]|nr:hypothetical protein [Bryobacterales bacterium]
MSFRSRFQSWHSLTTLGAVLVLHGVAACTLIPGAANARILTAALLFSAGLNAAILSLLFRNWTVARISFWMGGFRMVTGVGAVVTSYPESPDYRHLLVLMMVVISLLEFLAASQLRRQDEPHRAFQHSAVGGMIASAGMLRTYPVISDEQTGVMLGLSMLISGFAYLAIALGVRRVLRSARMALKRVETEEQVESAVA